MNPSVYQALCNRTECDQNNAIVRLSGAVAGKASNSMYLPVRLNHSVVGLAGEVGELASILQKMVYYGKPLTAEVRKDLLEEYGDVLWFVAEGLNALGADMGAVMEANIRKLKARFPEKYTDYHCAQENRDKVREALALGGDVVSGLKTKYPEEYRDRKAEAQALMARYDDEEAHTPVTRREIRQKELEAAKREEDQANAERDELMKRFEADRAKLMADKARVVQDGHGFGHAGLCEGD